MASSPQHFVQEQYAVATTHRPVWAEVSASGTVPIYAKNAITTVTANFVNFIYYLWLNRPRLPIPVESRLASDRATSQSCGHYKPQDTVASVRSLALLLVHQMFGCVFYSPGRAEATNKN